MFASEGFQFSECGKAAHTMTDYPVRILDGERMSTTGWVYRSEEPPELGAKVELVAAGSEGDPLLRIPVKVLWVHPNGILEAAIND